MKKIFDKLVQATDRAISGTLKKQMLFFTLTVVLVFLILLAVLTLLHPPADSRNNFFMNFVNMLYSFFDISSFLNTGDIDGSMILMVVAGLLSRVLFIGVMVSILTNAILHRINRVKNGEIYYSFSDHVVIIGFNELCRGLVAQLVQRNEIVLQTSMNVTDARHQVFSGLGEKLRKKVMIVSGNRVSDYDVRRLNIEKCTQVYLLGESGEDNHDSKNIECLGIINKIAGESGVNVRCNVFLGDHPVFHIFQQQDIPDIRGHIDFLPFNFSEMWARKVFVDNSYNSGEVVYRPLDRQPVTADSPVNVHLVIMGMSEMGIALGLQAAHICHFPNFITKGIKTRITFIDENADRELDKLKKQLNCFFNETAYFYYNYDENKKYSNVPKKKLTDVEIDFIKARFEDDLVQRYIETAALSKTEYLTIAVALPDSSAALSTALYLPEAVYESDTNILVRQNHSCAVAAMLSRESGAMFCKYRNLRPFGMLDNSFDLKHTDDLLPMMIKYVYDNTTDAKTVKEFPEDIIRKNWIENWRVTDNLCALKASNRYAANFITVKQRSLGITEGKELDPRQAELAAQMEHNRWIAEKLLAGFRAPLPKEAAALAEENKRVYYKAHFIHEDIKPYKELGRDEKSVAVRNYDINISASVPFMIEAYNKLSKK